MQKPKHIRYLCHFSYVAIFVALDLRPVSAADTDEACPVAIGHGGRAQQDVLKVAPSGILGTRLC